MTDRTDPSARGDDGTAEPDAVPPAAGQPMPDAINGKPGPDAPSARILADLNGSTPHRPAAKTGAGPGPADGPRQDDSGRGDSPEWAQEVREISSAGRFLIWLSGARHQILAECPTEQPKYTGLGLSVLIPGVMAAVSLAFALVTVLRTESWVALLFAVAWAAIIVGLDRTFVVSLPRKGTRQAQLLRAIPRFLLALILGLVISTPFVLQIFRPEISHQIQQIQAAERNAYFDGLPHSAVYLTIQRDEATVNQLTYEAATGGPGIDLAADPAIVGWQNQLATARNNEQTWFANLQCQLYGTALPSGGQCVKGNGTLAADDQQQYDYWKGQVSTLQAEIQQRTEVTNSQSAAQQRAVRQQAQAQLPAARRTLSSAQQQLTLQTDDVTSSISQDTGLLTRLKALGNVTAGDSTLNGARWLLFALFVVIDLMPVMIKVMLNLSPENNYDKMLEAEENRQLRAAAARTAARLSAEEAETAAWERVRQEKIRRWEAEQLQTGSGAAAPADSPEDTTQPPDLPA